MTRFEDGPAKGQILMLQHAVRFLRVTSSILPGSSKTHWDALDQLSDQPIPDETLYAYEIVGTLEWCFMDFGSPRRGGRYVMATYKFVQPQPTDADMRDETAWDAWCRSRLA